MKNPPPAVAAAWLETMDGLVRGLNHALSNRVNTLNTLLAVLQDAKVLDEELETALMAEEGRFEAVLGYFRLLPIDIMAEPEPLVLADPVKDAMALFGHHLDLRMLPCTTHGVDTAPPVRSRRTALTHALLAALITVGRPAVATGGRVAVEVSVEGEEVEVRAVAAGAPPESDDAAFTVMDWLAGSLGGTAARGVDSAGKAWASLRLLTLAAERKRGR